MKRSTFGRAGIVLLNIPAPGLGLLRIGRWKAAAVIYGGTLVSVLLLSFGPPLSFTILAALVLATAGLFLVAIPWSWIASANRPDKLPFYSRWYVVAGVCVVTVAINFVWTSERRSFRSFYLAAESMAPTLPKNDRIIAYMARPSDLRRGDLVLVRASDLETIYVKRVAALPNDRIALKRGVVFLNGRPIPQERISVTKIDDGSGDSSVRLSERFPGETMPHQIYDLGASPGDDFAEVRVAPDHVFVLGDNRDRSADSRFSKNYAGLEQVPLRDIVGRPLYHSFGSSKTMGALIH